MHLKQKNTSLFSLYAHIYGFRNRVQVCVCVPVCTWFFMFLPVLHIQIFLGGCTVIKKKTNAVYEMNLCVK